MEKRNNEQQAAVLKKERAVTQKRSQDGREARLPRTFRGFYSHQLVWGGSYVFHLHKQHLMTEGRSKQQYLRRKEQQYLYESNQNETQGKSP